MLDGSASSLWMIVGLFALLALFRPALILLSVLKQQFRYVTMRAVDVTNVPTELVDYLRSVSTALVEAGFVEFGWMTGESMEASQLEPMTCLILHHPEYASFATVRANPTGTGSRINFEARMTDGRRLESCHGESAVLIGCPPDTELIDTPSADTMVLWRRFRDRVIELGKGAEWAKPGTLEEEALASVHEVARAIDAWVAQGRMQPARDAGRFELTLRTALTLTWQATRHLSALKAFQTERLALDTVEQPIAQQVAACRSLQRNTQHRSRRWRFGSFLIVSGALFAISMLWFTEITTVTGLVVAVVIHELGHYLAMRLFGYRDTSIFFIPFFGAAAHGVKPEGRVHERLLVLLAGPVPGIVLASAISLGLPELASQPPWKGFVEALIVLNLFNLLPLLPLDGGRVVQLLSNDAHPLVESTLRLGSVVALGALGLYGRESLILGLAVAMLLAIAPAKRTADLVRTLRARGPVPEDDETRLAWVVGEMQAVATVPRERRCAFVVATVERLRSAQLRPLAALAWGGGYLSTLAVSMLSIVFLAGPNADHAVPSTVGEPLACNATDTLSSLGIGSARIVFSLTCELGDRVRSEKLASLLEAYTMLPRSSCLRAPWHDVSTFTAAELETQERARSTVTLIRREHDTRFQRYWRDDDRDVESDEWVEATPKQEAAYQAVEHKIAAELLELLKEREADPTFDMVAAKLYLETLDDPYELEEQTPAMAILAQRLGTVVTSCPDYNRREHTLAVPMKTSVRIMGTRLVPADLSSIAAYLCSQGCSLTQWTRPAPDYPE